MNETTSPLGLRAERLNLAFGGLAVTRDVSLSLPPGSRTALIGPNGAGKTTLVNLLSGALQPASGEVVLGERSVTGLSQSERVRLGLARTFQISRLFKEMSVFDNVRVAVLHRRRRAMRWWQSKADEDRVRADVDEVLGQLGLRALAERQVGKLSLGEQRLVEIALALALKPRVLLLDEPAAGVPQGESGRIMGAIESLPTELAVLFIEHDMDLVFRFARHIVVLVAGAVLVEGLPRDVATNEQVKQIYFGRDHGHQHQRH